VRFVLVALEELRALMVTPPLSMLIRGQLSDCAQPVKWQASSDRAVALL
jgi:hypothetical protein